MRVRHLDHQCPRDLVVRVDDPDATVADLAEALEPDRPVGPLLVDGRVVAMATPLDRAGIGDGAELRRVGPGLAADAVDRGAEPLAAMLVTTGRDAGARFDLAAGSHLIGRDRPHPAGTRPSIRIDDPTVSARHARLVVHPDGRLVLDDLGSTNGTWIGPHPLVGPEPVAAGTEVRFGAARVVLAAAPARRPDRDRLPVAPSARTHPRHRPPRPERPTPGPPIVAPAAPEPPGAMTPVGVLGVVASVALGAAMVVVLGSPTYALFALLGPALVVANAIDARRRRRRARRRGDRRRRAELRAFAAAISAAQDLEREDRRVRFAGPHHAVAVATGADPTLWERRPHHVDAYEVRLGVGGVPWCAPVEGDARSWADDVGALVDDHRELADAPVGVRLDPDAPIAIVGPASARMALARSLIVQATVAHGPADLEVAVLAGPTSAARWDWCCWLPHATTADGSTLLAGSPPDAAAVAERLLEASARSSPRRLVVLDDHAALAGRRGPARTILRATGNPAIPLVPIVLVERTVDVPAACRVVLEVDRAGNLVAPGALATGPAVVVGVSERTATEAARALARHDDPEVDDPGRVLPATVALTALLGPDRSTAAGLAARWRAGGADPAPTAVIGVAADGPLVVDLATDGPHALVVGTTGSGKSELLRTLVTSLAASSSPDHLTFLLIDFKGGGAFDACARLPHTTGVVTDLDDHLAARALRCLDAELRLRERRLREVGADDLTGLRRRHPGGPPLPRLVVVVDEFATLAAELPDFVDALVGVAQRGRSLGVHLVLATQRPAGAVSEQIRANTALRIALRVHAPADSSDVVGVPDAAALPRRRPGRALVRLGPGELVRVQTALVSGPVPQRSAEHPSRGAAVQVRPLRIDTGTRSTGPGPGPGDPAAPTELDRLADAMVEAWARRGGRPPRRPWPDPLPDEVDWPLPSPPPGHAAHDADADDQLDQGDRPLLVVGLGDDPDRQRLVPFAWRLDDGPLLAVGLSGSDTGALAATAVLAAAQRWRPASCHVHVIDLGSGGLVPLAGLAHVGAVIGADDRERQRRLVAELSEELACRRGAAPRTPTGAGRRPHRFLVVHGVGAFHARWDDLDPHETWGRLLDLLSRGTDVGIHVVLTAEGPGAATHQVVAACRQRLVFRLGDRADHAAFGIAPADVPPLPPGRALAADGAIPVQVAHPTAGLGAAVARLVGSAPCEAVGIGDAMAGLPEPVGVLPHQVGLHELAPGHLDPDGTLRLPLGRSDIGLVTAMLVLRPGGHGLVVGPPRTGRTTCLATLGAAARGLGVAVVAVTSDPRDWSGSGFPVVAPSAADLADLLDRVGPLLVLVDDADLTAEDHPCLGRVVRERRPDRHVVVSARTDRARSLYGHWTREVRADRAGILLVPDPDLDGELIGARLPRRPPVRLGPGRGWLSGGEPEGFVQVARAGPTEPGPCPTLAS